MLTNFDLKDTEITNLKEIVISFNLYNQNSTNLDL